MAGRIDLESFWPWMPKTTLAVDPDGRVQVVLAPAEKKMDHAPKCRRSDFVPAECDDATDESESDEPVVRKRPSSKSTKSTAIFKRPIVNQPILKRAMSKPILKRPMSKSILKLPIDVQTIVNPPTAVVLKTAPTIVKATLKRPSSQSTSSACSAQMSGMLRAGFPGFPGFIKTKYVKTGAIGIRIRGGRQVMQVAFAHASADVIDAWTESCVQQLLHGETVDVVKQWLTEQKVKFYRD